MSIRLYNGTTWNNQTSLQIYNGASWVKSQKGWVYNGASWLQFYPEYPQNTVLPTITGNAIQGNTLTCGTGTWTSNDAYIPTSYSYQWKSGATNVGTNSNQYITQLSDNNATITCQVTATNNRGVTTATSSNGIVIQPANPDPPATASISDVTEFSPALSAVTVTTLAQPDGQTTANVQGTAGIVQSGQVSPSGYDGSASVGSLTSFNPANLSGQVTGGTPGATTTVNIRSFNSATKVRATWSSVSLATSYDVTFYGSNGATLGSYNTTGTTYTLQVNTSGVTWYAVVYSRNASGVSLTGRTSNTIIPSYKYSTYTSGSATFQIQQLPSFTVAPSASNILDTTALISWSATNQAQYNLNSLGWTATSSGTNIAYSRTLTGLTANTYYQPLVEIRSSTLNYTNAYVSQFRTNIIPTVTATVTGITSTGGTLSWTSTNQASYTISTSPFTALDGASGFTATSRLFTGLTAGTTYSYTVTVYSSTNYPASYSGSFTTTGGGSAPASPTNVLVTASGAVSWTASSGATSYTVEYYCASDSSGSNVSGPYYGNVSTTSYQISYPTVNSILLNYARARVNAGSINGTSAYSAFYPASGYV